MQNIFIELLPPWVETGLQPAFYDKESGTVLQQTARMYARVNQLTQAFNTFSEDTAETVNDYIERFTTLYTYVHDYFDNLDVQEEINNKLDQMVEAGTLQEIIYQFLQSNVAWTFNTVADMKLSENLIDGSFARTMGFHSINDGGLALYKIKTHTNETINELDTIAIGDSLIAELVTEYPLNVKKFGAYGDNSHDDTNALQLVFNKSAIDGGDIFFPAGKYKVTSPITVKWGQNLTNRRPKLQHIYGCGSQSFELTYDNTAIVGYNIPANRGIIELLGSGNSWSTHTKIEDISLMQDKDTCNANSFCLFYGDANQFELNKVKMLGYNDVLVRCGSDYTDGGSGYAGINTRYINTKFGIFEDYSKGFAILPERIIKGSGGPMDNLVIESCGIGGVAVIDCVMLSVKSSHIALKMQVKDKTTTNVGSLNGIEVDYSTGFLLNNFTVAKFTELYCEDYRRAIDVYPMYGICGNLVIDQCYFNAKSNQIYNNNYLIADYGVITRANANQSTWKIKNMVVKDSYFRQRSGVNDVFNFNQHPIENNIAEVLNCENNVNFDSMQPLDVYTTVRRGFHINPIGYKRSEKIYSLEQTIGANEVYFDFENGVESIITQHDCYATGVELYFDTAVADAAQFVILIYVDGVNRGSFDKSNMQYTADKKYFCQDAGVGYNIPKGSEVKVSMYSTTLGGHGLIGQPLKAKITFNN